MLNENEVEPLLRLALIPGIGPQRLGALIEAFGSAERVLHAPSSSLRGVPGLGPSLVSRVQEARGSEGRARAARAAGTLERMNATVVTPRSAAYPASFRTLSDPPYLLFAAGDLGLLRLPGIAVVGTRDPTAYGRSTAERIAGELGRAGFSIVSGMARGIDSAAHGGALKSGSATIAVLGNGIEQVYPWENRKLRDQILEKGLILSEYPPGETPKPGNFPRRNRIITALSEAILVVEMGLQSGAQHTVSYALEQGKEVMAVPGSINSAASAGTNQLIRDGARLVVSAAEVIEELRGVGSVSVAGLKGTAGSTRDREKSVAVESPVLPMLTAEEERIIRSMSVDPIHVDDLALDAGESAAGVLTTLLHLEMRGLVNALPGKRYSLAAP